MPREEIEKLSKDNDYIEETARRELNMVREGEVIYRFANEKEDKEASKKVFRYHGIHVPPYVVLGHRSVNGLPAVDFPRPWVVKPAAEGSSIGVSIVRQEHDFRKAIEQAHLYGPRVIIEQYIDGKEIHMGVLNGEVIGGVEVRPSLEFYSYEAKYTSGLTEYILPPEVEGAVYERAGRTAFSAHQSLGCKGATRVDLRIHSLSSLKIIYYS